MTLERLVGDKPDVCVAWERAVVEELQSLHWEVAEFSRVLSDALGSELQSAAGQAIADQIRAAREAEATIVNKLAEFGEGPSRQPRDYTLFWIAEGVCARFPQGAERESVLLEVVQEYTKSRVASRHFIEALHPLFESWSSRGAYDETLVKM